MIPLSSWVVIGSIALFFIIGAATHGFPAFLISFSVLGLITALYTVVSGRKSWARLAGRRMGGAVAIVSFVVLIASAGTVTPVDADSAHLAAQSSATSTPTAKPTPTTAPGAAFTAEEPIDPSTVIAATESASVVVADSSVTQGTALALLETIPVKGRAPQTGYARTADFGRAWIDVDRNGCDTRNDILSRDLADTVHSGLCRVTSGKLTSPYTNESVDFVRGEKTSALVQIDHLVSLGDAWQTGAQQLTLAQRISLANDPLNLLAVDGRSNDQKGDGDAATWLPANKAFRCTYVARQVSVKATYGLWMTAAEHDAIARVLASCLDQVAMTSTFAPAPAPVVAPAPAPVVVVPVPVPAPVAPAPVAPAPAAPAPAAPAPAAPVSPGAYCPNALVGQSGVAANGRTYVCGGKGADAGGRYHWNV